MPESERRVLLAERSALVGDELAADDWAADVSPEWRAEIERRLADIGAGRSRPIPLDQARAMMREHRAKAR